jgi:hypothetical protein
MVQCENLQKLFKELSLEGGAMHFVLLHSIMQSSKRAKQRLLDSLQPPSATEVRHTKKDRTGFVMGLVVATFLIAFVLVI